MAAFEPSVTARWEWRTFGETLASLATEIGMEENSVPRESEEIYLLNFAGSRNAKIRDGLLDIKALQERDPGGLELWKPVFKAAFPLSASALETAFSAWELRAPALERQAYALDEFLREIAGRHKALRAVKVIKARRKLTVHGCAAEFVQVRGEGLELESFCIESADKFRLLAALSDLGLDARANVNFPEGLKRAVGAQSERPAAGGGDGGRDRTEVSG